jgi:hypothetical protein
MVMLGLIPTFFLIRANRKEPAGRVRPSGLAQLTPSDANRAV